MILLTIISCLLLAGCSANEKTHIEKDLVITDNYFLDQFLMYTGQHDIVKIFAPPNQFHFTEDDESNEKLGGFVLFFVEADIENGKRTDQGLYVFDKFGKTTKLLDNGKDAIATNENVIYFGATDGLYKYNEVANTAEKYGTVTDNIIQLAHSNKTNAVYYLTDKHELYKLSDDGKTGVKLPFEDVQSVAFDFFDNMYYYDSNNNVYVVNGGADGVPNKVQGLPSEIKKIMLASRISGIDVTAFLLADDRLYLVYHGGTAQRSFIKFEAQITAAAPQPYLVQFHAKDKKLYAFNLINIVKNKRIPELTAYIDEYKNEHEKDHKASIDAIKKGSFM